MTLLNAKATVEELRRMYQKLQVKYHSLAYEDDRRKEVRSEMLEIAQLYSEALADVRQIKHALAN